MLRTAVFLKLITELRNEQMKDKVPLDGPGSLPSESSSDTYLVDQVLQQARDKSDDDAMSAIDVAEELHAIRSEVDRISVSLGLLAGSAKTLVSETPNILEREVRSFVQRKPLTALIGTVALSFGLTLRLFGLSNRRPYE